MLTELCKEINNYFETKKVFGKFTIEDGELKNDIYLQDGQYFRIVGSVFNDGVYQYPATELKDEIFEGAVWAMAVPQAVIALADEIDEWKEKYAGVDSVAMSPFQSESFGGYSYSKASGTDAGGNTAGDWRSVFASQLNNYRKVAVL